MGKKVTVVLRCSLEEALPHLERHFPGAKTRVARDKRGVQRFVGIQHPAFDRMGIGGCKAICLARGLPMRSVNRQESYG